MVNASYRLYREAYSGLSREMWWLALVMFINRSGTMVIPFLTVYLTTRGYTLTQAGFVMGAFGIGAILGSYIGGILTDRFGHFYVQVVSLFLNGILFLVLGQMEGITQIAVCIFILSTIGEAFRPANSAAIAAYSNETNRTRCYSLNRLAINLGWAFGPAIGGLLASRSYSLLFLVDGLTCMGAAMMLYFLFKPIHSRGVAKTAKEKNSSRSAYKDPPFLLGMAYIFLVGICFFQMFSVIPVFYKDHVKLNESTIGWILAMNGLLIAIFEMVLVYKLENRRTALSYMVSGSLLIGLSFLILNISPVLMVVIFSMVVVTLGEMLLFPFMNNFWVKRSNETNRGQYAALYTMSFSAAIVLAPTVASQIATLAGFDILWYFDAAVCGIAGTGFYFLKKKKGIHE